jgi:hypothetical protein
MTQFTEKRERTWIYEANFARLVDLNFPRLYIPLDKNYNVRPIIIFTGGMRHFGEKAEAIKGGSLAEYTLSS